MFEWSPGFALVRSRSTNWLLKSSTLPECSRFHYEKLPMTAPFKLSPMARGLTTLYTSALLAGMWSMMVPAVPVMAKFFAVSPGTAAQIITALALGRFAGMPLSGTVLDRLGTRAALTSGPTLACGAAILAGITPWFGLILAMVFLIGVGESIWVIAREVAGIDLARLDQRGR